jgi:hypothetical protein
LSYKKYHDWQFWQLINVDLSKLSVKISGLVLVGGGRLSWEVAITNLAITNYELAITNYELVNYELVITNFIIFIA